MNVTTDSISIRGARRREKTVRDEDYLYQECYWGKFGRSIILPQEVDPEGAERQVQERHFDGHAAQGEQEKDAQAEGAGGLEI